MFLIVEDMSYTPLTLFLVYYTLLLMIAQCSTLDL